MSEQEINVQEPKTDIVVDYKFAAENSSVIDDMYDMIGDQYYEIPEDVESSNITADDGKHIHSPAATPAHSYDNRINSGYAEDSSPTDGIRKQLGSCSDKVASQNAQPQDAYVFNPTCLQQQRSILTHLLLLLKKLVSMRVCLLLIIDSTKCMSPAHKNIFI